MYDFSQQPAAMQERYKELPEEVVELFEYDTVTQVMEDTVREFGLRDTDVPVLKMEIEMVLYFFLSREGFAERLQESLEIEKTRAEEIAKKINTDLFALVESYLSLAEQESANNTVTAEDLPSVIVAPPIQTQPTPEPALTEVPKEEKYAQVKPIRTFAMDVDISRAHSYGATAQPNSEGEEEEEPVHRSNQDDILKKWGSKYPNSLK